MIRVCINGADGNMGGLVAKNVIQDPDLELVGALTMVDSPNEGKDIGTFLGLDKINVPMTSIVNLGEILKNNVDMFVDYTITEAAEKNIPIVLKNGINCIIGTTGLSETFKDEFARLVKENKVAGMISPNMSLGVNIFFKVAEILTELLPNYDIEIIEAHHHRKRDSPSGTAKKVAQLIAAKLHKNLENIAKYGRSGFSPRKIGAEEIGIHAIRAGDIVGDHTVLFAGNGERIELKHQAHSRQCFAAGTILAIKYMTQHGPGLYQMSDLLK
ncbi:MAG: 4-hydroxy-tetrahydrodipicolinate reductase [Candidatus Helarchaeota archaeon]